MKWSFHSILGYKQRVACIVSMTSYSIKFSKFKDVNVQGNVDVPLCRYLFLIEKKDDEKAGVRPFTCAEAWRTRL